MSPGRGKRGQKGESQMAKCRKTSIPDSNFKFNRPDRAGLLLIIMYSYWVSLVSTSIDYHLSYPALWQESSFMDEDEIEAGWLAVGRLQFGVVLTLENLRHLVGRFLPEFWKENHCVPSCHHVPLLPFAGRRDEWSARESRQVGDWINAASWDVDPAMICQCLECRDFVSKDSRLVGSSDFWTAQRPETTLFSFFTRHHTEGS